MGYGIDQIKSGADLDRYMQLRMPVELSEEWLKKFGFKQLDKYTWNKNGFFIHKRKEGFVFNIGKKKYIQKYVHTLQNTYFITGRELTINEQG